MHTVDSVYVDCPQLDAQTYTTYWSETFTITYGVDYTGGLKATDGGIIGDMTLEFVERDGRAWGELLVEKCDSSEWNQSEY